MLRYLENVLTLELDRERCTGCGMCATVCPHGVFDVAGGRAEIMDRDACMECGACAANCPAEAIRVRPGVGCATGILYARLRSKAERSGAPGTCAGADDCVCGR